MGDANFQESRVLADIVQQTLRLNGYPDEGTVPCPVAALDELVASYEERIDALADRCARWEANWQAAVSALREIRDEAEMEQSQQIARTALSYVDYRQADDHEKYQREPTEPAGRGVKGFVG